MRMLKNLHGVLFITLAIPLSIQAAEWSAKPRVTLRTGYNDNIRMTTQTHDPVWETILSPALKLGVLTQSSGLTGDAGFAVRRFVGGSGRESGKLLNREDYHLNTNAYRNTPLSRINADLNYTRDSTLDSELDQTGHVTDNRATRDKLTLEPSWSRLLSELTRLNLSYQYNTIKYTDDPGIADLVGYKYHVASASLVHQFSPRLQGTLSAGYSSYRPDTDFNSDTLSLQAGLSRNFTQTLVASFLIGQRQSASDSFVGTGFCIGALPGASYPTCTGGIAVPTGSANTTVETTSAVYSASITKTLETGSLGASLSRSSSPSSLGELLDATRLTLTGSHDLTETLHTYLNINYTENETIVNRVGLTTTNQGKETFLRVTPGVAWHWRREWILAGEYRYVNNEDPVAGTATRNALYVSLTYQPPKRYLSR